MNILIALAAAFGLTIALMVGAALLFIVVFAVLSWLHKYD